MMTKKTNFWLVLLVAAALLVPGLGQAKDKPEKNGQEQWQHLVKELNLAPDKSKAFQEVDAKYRQMRQDAIVQIKNNEDALEKAMGAAHPDEAKIKELVAQVVDGHTKLFEAFKNERQAEMALLTPMQQAKFLLELKKWHQQMRQKYEEKK